MFHVKHSRRSVGAHAILSSLRERGARRRGAEGKRAYGERIQSHRRSAPVCAAVQGEPGGSSVSVDRLRLVLDADGSAVPKPVSVSRSHAARRRLVAAEGHRAARSERAHVPRVGPGVPARQSVQRSALVSLSAVHRIDARGHSVQLVPGPHGAASRPRRGHLPRRVHPHRMRHGEHQPGDKPRVRLHRATAGVV